MQKITPHYEKENNGHYTPGMIAGGLLYISGQLSINPDTREIPAGGIEVEIRQALDNLERVLKAAGASREDVVQCRIYLADIADWDKANGIYAEFFGAHKPARIVVPTGKLHFGCLTEIEAIAEVEKK